MPAVVSTLWVATLHVHPPPRSVAEVVACTIASVVAGLKLEVALVVVVRVATLAVRARQQVSLVRHGLVAQHDDVRQRLPAIPASEDDQVRTNCRGRMSVALRRGNADVLVANPIHVRRSQCQAIVAGLLLLELVRRVPRARLDLVPQGEEHALVRLLGVAGVAAEDDGVVLREHDGVPEAARGRNAVRSEAGVLHARQVQDSDVVEVAALHEVAALILHADLGRVQTEAAMDQQGLTDERGGVAVAGRGLGACRLRRRPRHGGEVQAIEVAEVLAAGGAAEDVEPRAVQRGRVPVPRGRGASGAGALEPGHGTRVQSVKVPEVRGLALAAEEYDARANERGGVAVARLWGRAPTSGLIPRILVDIEDVRIVEILKALSLPLVVVAAEDEYSGRGLLRVRRAHQRR
mmetsp:Transcript_147300/g.473218  ORF Transcript_147300/g.473218 Transcript_147300/m.473218 type:complete len:406 (+) Transcript_147300:87-1304(+)